MMRRAAPFLLLLAVLPLRAENPQAVSPQTGGNSSVAGPAAAVSNSAGSGADARAPVSADGSGVAPAAAPAAVEASIAPVVGGEVIKEEQTAPEAGAETDPAAILEQHGLLGRNAPARPSAKASLNGAIGKISSGRVAEAGGDETALEAVFAQVYDAAKRGGGASVAGKVLQVRDKMKRIEDIAGKDSAADSPALYRAEIEEARKTFADHPTVAQLAVDAVLSAARATAKTALPRLAEQAYRAAQAGESLKSAFERFNSWDKLLGSGGRHLIARYADLKADIEHVQKTAASASPAQPKFKIEVDAEGNFAAAPALKTVERVADQAAPMQLNEAAADSGSRVARVSPIRLSGLSVFTALRAIEPPGPAGFLRAAGQTAVYWMEAAWNYIRSLLGRLFGASYAAPDFSAEAKESELAIGAASFKIWATAGTDPEAARESLRLASAILDQGTSIERLLARPRRDLRVAREALSQARSMADQFEKLTGDASPRRAVASLSRAVGSDIARLGLADNEALPPALASLISSGGDFSLGHWTIRMSGEALWSAAPRARAFVELAASEQGGLAVLRYPAEPAADGKRRRALESLGFEVSYRAGVAQAALTARSASVAASELAERLSSAQALAEGKSAAAAGLPPSAAAGLERLIVEMRQDSFAAEKTAVEVQSLGPSPERYEPLGRVGSMLAQVAPRHDRQGHPVNVIVLRDREGVVADARIESQDGRSILLQDIAP